MTAMETLMMVSANPIPAPPAGRGGGRGGGWASSELAMLRPYMDQRSIYSLPSTPNTVLIMLCPLLSSLCLLVTTSSLSTLGRSYLVFPCTYWLT